MEIPDKIPQYCNWECKYWKDIWSGKCTFYNEDVIGGYDCDCIAVTKFGVLPTSQKDNTLKCQ